MAMPSRASTASPTRRPASALTDFRKQHAFPAAAPAMPNCSPPWKARPARQAARRRAIPSAMTTRAMLLVATGKWRTASHQSRGWWRSRPGACARLITTPLDSDAVYLLAQKRTGGTLVGGPEQFCIAAQEFEIEGRSQCAKHGYRQRALRRTVPGFCAPGPPRPSGPCSWLCRPYRTTNGLD